MRNSEGLSLDWAIRIWVVERDVETWEKDGDLLLGLVVEKRLLI